jgi:RHH-type proline utilization regulon transcriptional repressor/proline dehydrogenase/delta 1-pyrroline-5-carboxylate dehydrogenase
MIDDHMVKKLRQEFSSLGEEFFNFLTETVESYSSIISLPGPTGESNELTYQARGCALCFGPLETDSIKQTILALALGNHVISQINSKIFSSLLGIGFNKSSITRIEGMPSNEIFENNYYHTIMYFGDALSVERILENKREEIIPIVNSIYEPWQLVKERVISIDTTASGGNANLLAL